MVDLLEPPVPADCDLREFAFTPIYRSRLFGSDFHANTTDSEWRAGVTLWLKSWEQVPAGSLPSDDIGLARLAEFARDVKQWKKVKTGALHGWIECSDGRLYHPVVTEVVLEAWQKKRTASDKGKAGAAKRWHSGNGQAHQTDSTGNATANSTGIPQAMARAMPGDSNRREGKGIEGKGRDVYESDAREPDSTGMPQPLPGQGLAGGNLAPRCDPTGFTPLSLEQAQQLQSAYPVGIYRQSEWLVAQRMVNHHLASGHDFDELLGGAGRYREQCKARESIGTQYVLSPVKFFDRETPQFADLFPLPRTKGEVRQDANIDAAHKWLAQSEGK